MSIDNLVATYAGTSEEFISPAGLGVVSNGVLLVADTNNHVIRRVLSTGSMYILYLYILIYSCYAL